MKRNKIKVILGRGISSNLDCARRLVKEFFKLPSLVAADEYIAECINSLLNGKV